MRQEKQLLLDEVKEKIDQSNGFIIAGYEKFSAARARQFRDRMAEVGGEFEVVKKRVFIKAAELFGVQFDVKKLKGHIGIVFANQDAMALAKQVVKFGEDNDNAVAVLGGQIDGEKCSAEDVVAIAKLPGLQELRAQILGLFEAPLSQTAATLQSMLTSVIYCLDEKSKKE